TTIGQRSETIEAHIDPDLSRAWRKRLGLAFDREAHEPFVDIAFDRNRLNRSLDGPVQLNFDGAGSLDTEFPLVQKSASVAIRRKRDAVISSARTEPGESRSLATFTPGVEPLESLVQPPQNILATGIISQLGQAIRPYLFELIGLLEVVD